MSNQFSYLSEEDQEKLKSVTFNASFPDIQSAIKITGGGDGMRIQFDIPESDLQKALAMMNWRRLPLQVTVKPLPTPYHIRQMRRSKSADAF